MEKQESIKCNPVIELRRNVSSRDPPHTHREPHVRRDHPSPAVRGAQTDRGGRQNSIGLPPLTNSSASRGVPADGSDAVGVLAAEPQLPTSDLSSDQGLLSWDTLCALRGSNSVATYRPGSFALSPDGRLCTACVHTCACHTLCA
jgi:hypothetical protein